MSDAGGLAALAKPFEKLVEVCAAGVGGLYAPTGIRRRARAEADALLILEEAQARKNEIAVRAAQRLLDNEERRQANIESVVEKAKLALPDEVSQVPVDEDWTAGFFQHVQDVGNQEMQTLWGKLLAGEVATPGSFSPRTLRILSDLTSREASLFEALASLRLVMLATREPFLFFSDDDKSFGAAGINWSAMQELDVAGLIQDHGLTGVQITRANSPLLVEAPGRILFVLSSESPLKVALGKVTFTRAGAELSRLASWLWNADHMKSVVEGWRRGGWTVEAKTILKYTPGGAEVEDLPMPF